jgi:hypothetical protein
MRSRLATVAADLDESLQNSASGPVAKSGIAAASYAMRKASLSLVDTDSEHLLKLVEQLDEAYFSAQSAFDVGRGTKESVLSAFARARAASAFAFALRGEAAEAVYEAIASTDDVPAVRRLVQEVLANGSA